MTENTLGPAMEAFPEWRGYVNQLALLAEKVGAMSSGPHDDQWQKELYQFLYSQISVGYLYLISNPDYPEFVSYNNPIYRQAIPNPDDTLLQAIIDDTGIYSISGFRGKARIVSIQLANDVGAIARMKDDSKELIGGSKGVFNVDSASVGEDGSFEILLSAERPAGYQGDWWKLERGATSLILRQRHYDWINETDGQFAIERLDVPVRKPRITSTEIDAALKKISKYIEAYSKVSFDGSWTRHLRAASVCNKLKPIDYSGAAGLENQAFVEGMFALSQDEALIIETELPESCEYWGFHLADDFWQSIDWENYHSSLNGFSARIDTDGKLRIVVSAQDPGVQNWLDTVGHARGFIYGRWTNASSYPTPEVIKVKAADVRQHLPQITPIVSSQEREVAIRLRRKAVQMRRR